MFDFTHKKRPDFVQLILIIAVVCFVLGAITPSASALEYDWDFSVESPESGEVSGTIYLGGLEESVIPNALPDGSSLHCQFTYYGNRPKGTLGGYYGSLTDIINSGIYTDLPYGTNTNTHFYRYWVDVGTGLSDSQANVYVRQIAEFLKDNTNILTTHHHNTDYYAHYDGNYSTVLLWAPLIYPMYTYEEYFDYTYEPSSPAYPFNIDVVDSGNDYLISVSGIDGSPLAGSAYTIAVSTYSGGYNLPLTSFPMYLGDSPVHLWTTDQTFTLPIYLYDGVTPIDYYCVMSFPADPTATGYPFWWNMTTHGSLDYPFNTTYPPVVLPTPTPLIPSDIIPDPESLNNTVNITGWYQDMGYEGNNITAPIYSGIRGWFNENLVPVIDFFLVPTNYVATVISDSAETSTDGISYITEELGSYAAPFNIVGGYVILLVPDVVWIVVFAALSIGYVVLLIRVSTGSIKDTIGRFLGGK